MRMPEQGRSRDDVLSTLRSYKSGDADWSAGRSMTNVYLATEEGKRVAEEAYTLYLWENALDPTAYQSIPRLEREVLGMAAAHLGGDDRVVGSFTSGGTESCLMAVKASRDHAREHHPDRQRPQIVLSTTTHACFHKAAQYFGLDAVVVPVDPDTLRADPVAIEAAITSETVLVVASAPSYPHGVVDPIPELAAIARERDVLFHVDACIGGFALPFIAETGRDVPPFDFSIDGVTSMSMDFHKYALCAKGASVVLYREPELRRHQFFAYSDWPSYVVMNTTTASSKSGGPVAATWATLNHYGRDGYREIFDHLRSGTEKAIAGVSAHPDLRVLGEPDMTIFAIASDTVDVFRLGDAMKQRGWDMYPQLSHGDLPATLHVTLMPGTVPQLDQWIDDLGAAIDEVRGSDHEDSLAEVRGAIGALDLSSLTTSEVEELMVGAGIGAESIGGPMADVNQLLDQLPRDVVDKVLTVFLDHLTRPA